MPINNRFLINERIYALQSHQVSSYIEEQDWFLAL